MTKWEKQLAKYDKLVDGNLNFVRKGKTMPYTSANGYMFSLLNKSAEFGIRLPKESAEKFKKKYNTTIFMSYGSVMKDYVLVPEQLLEKPKILRAYLQKSYEHVMSLPTK